jgi:hypothetical protein
MDALNLESGNRLYKNLGRLPALLRRINGKKNGLPIRDKCLEMNAAFFFKQWGGVNKKVAGNLLQGELWQQMPKVITSQPSQQLLFPA